MTSNKKTIRIGGGSAFWGDSNTSFQQLVRGQSLDYLMLEYLAEITMALLARARAKSEEAGFVPEFIVGATPHLKEIKDEGIKVITNAGGMNPAACARALRQAAEKQGISFRIAVVEGDDLVLRAEEFRQRGIGDWRTNAPLPSADKLLSMNAYLGATPVAAALAAGAEIVITGRNVDSALVLGPLMHEFGWRADDFDLLAAGSLCGHLIECGPQATGGNFTDWDSVPDWENIGYPIAECAEDGSFLITKPSGTGGLVTTRTVGEQLLYEIDDPASYLLPDVTVDLRKVTLLQTAKDQVSVQGARGRPPTDSYKTTVTYSAGYRSTAVFMIAGIDAVAKGQRTADAILAKCRRIFNEANLPDFTETSVELLGSESSYGAAGRAGATREVMVKIAVKHSAKAALEIFSREIAPASISMAPGITGFYAGRPGVSPVVGGTSVLIPKSAVPVRVTMDDREIFSGLISVAAPNVAVPALSPITPTQDDKDLVEVPLVEIAHVRSGDKGDDALIAVLARNPEYLPYIARSLTEENVAERFRHLPAGKVIRFDVPGTNGFIFQLRNALGGGGLASLRIDPQGKVLAQTLLDVSVGVPASWAQRDGLKSGARL
jgi:hypothetical protein